MNSVHSLEEAERLIEVLWALARTSQDLTRQLQVRDRQIDANNHAERTLRRLINWRKISFGTRSARGSRYVERTLTVVGGCRLQGRNVLDFLTRAIQAYWGHGTAPSLVPT